MTITLDAGASSRRRLKRHASELVRLGTPVVLSRAGSTILLVLDVVMVGRAGTEELAFQSIGFAVANTVQMIGLGLLLGTLVTAAAAIGRGAPLEAGQAWRRSVPYAATLGALGAAFCLTGPYWLPLLGQPPELAAGAGTVIAIIGLSLPGQLLFLTSSFFLEGIGRPLAATVTILLAVILKAFLNWVLVFGNLGAAELGAEGAAIGLVAVRTLMGIALVVWILLMYGRSHGTRVPWRGGWRPWRTQRRIGQADGASLGLESAAFTALNLMAGLLGAVHVASYAIALNLLSILFTFALGIGAASAVRVGMAFGRRDAPDLAIAGWTGLAIHSLAIALVGLPLILVPGLVVSAYSSDPAVLALAGSMVPLLVLTLFADGGQRVVAQALRGCGDTWVPTLSHLFAYVFVMFPLGWYLGVVLDLGGPGLLLAIAIASVVSVSVLIARFVYLSRVRLPRRFAEPGEPPAI